MAAPCLEITLPRGLDPPENPGVDTGESVYDLLERARTGDRAATTRLLEMVRPHLEACARGYCDPAGGESTADLVQESWLRAWQRLDQFDYDMILMTLPQSLSPGLEQWLYFHSSQAGVKGSKNYAGVRHPVVDSLLEQLLAAAFGAGTVSRAATHHVLPRRRVNILGVRCWRRQQY